MMGLLLACLALVPMPGTQETRSMPWADEPRTVTLLDMEAAFRGLPKTERREPIGNRYREWWEAELYMKLCARAAGDRGTESYRHEVEISVEKTATDAAGCLNYRVDYRGQEGAYPEYHLVLTRPERRVPARRIYLLSDGFRWFLYLSGESPGNIFQYHDGEVIRINLWDESESGRPDLLIHLVTKCRGHVADDQSDCYDCETWKNQGRKLEDFRGDSIFRCIRPKLLDGGPEIIRWSTHNHQCFFDYSVCVD